MKVAFAPLAMPRLLVIVRLASPLNVLLEAKVTVPVPRAALLLMARVPALRSVPPV